MTHVFELKGDYIELIQLLKVVGLCDTGGMAKAVVEDGLVAVEGETELRKRRKLRVGQTVEFQGETVIIR